MIIGVGNGQFVWVVMMGNRSLKSSRSNPSNVKITYRQKWDKEDELKWVRGSDPEG